MSLTGKHGRGFVLDSLPVQQRMVVATSLCKAYATGGVAVIFPNARTHRQVKNCGGPMIFSGPFNRRCLERPLLRLASTFRLKLTVCNGNCKIALRSATACLKHTKYPQHAIPNRRFFYIKLGLPEVAGSITKYLLDDGFYTNHAVYPAVSRRKSGIRFTLTGIFQLKIFMV